MQFGKEPIMLYLVQASTTFEGANTLEASGKFEEIVEYVMKRFRPKALYANATKREGIWLVELPSQADVFEFSYIITKANGKEPVFTPLIPWDEMAAVFESVKKAPVP